jgi:hypothetical protein
VLCGETPTGVAGVHHAGGFDEHGVHLTVRDWAVLDTSRNDEQLARTHLDVAVLHLDGQFAGDDEEQFVSVLMGVPGEFALDLDDLDLVVVHPRHHLR